jgi:F-box/leucine-rich repeat protein 2/20
MAQSATMVGADLYLPNECWESIVKFLNDDNHLYLESLSLVSKHFLSLTNRLRSSLTINTTTPFSFSTHPFLHRLFKRFPNLTSLDLTPFQGDLDKLLFEISCFPLKLTSLKLSDQRIIPAHGLRAFSEKITTLSSLTCTNIDYIGNNDLILISQCFPYLQQLDFSTNNTRLPKNVGVNIMFMALPMLRKVDLSSHSYIDDSSFLNLCKGCEFLEEVIINTFQNLSQDGIASAIRERPTLRSLSIRWNWLTWNSESNVIQEKFSSEFIDSLVSLKELACLDLSTWRISDELLSSIAMGGLPLRKLVLQQCFGYSYAGIFSLLSKCRCIQHLNFKMTQSLNDQHVIQLSRYLGDLLSINLSNCRMLTESTLFALVRNCPSLREINMEHTSIGKNIVENSGSLMDFGVYPQLKSLHLAANSWLKDENINTFAFFFPNLQLLDLRCCNGISEKGIGQVLRRCCKIRHLNLTGLKSVSLRMNFKVSTLEVLNLSRSGIDDISLYLISKSCYGLLQLDLGHCFDVSEIGVRLVLENCTRLRELNLQGCGNVSVVAVHSMVFTRPSLRIISGRIVRHCDTMCK